MQTRSRDCGRSGPVGVRAVSGRVRADAFPVFHPLETPNDAGIGIQNRDAVDDALRKASRRDTLDALRDVPRGEQRLIALRRLLHERIERVDSLSSLTQVHLEAGGRFAASDSIPLSSPDRRDHRVGGRDALRDEVVRQPAAREHLGERPRGLGHPQRERAQPLGTRLPPGDAERL